MNNQEDPSSSRSRTQVPTFTSVHPFSNFFSEFVGVFKGRDFIQSELMKMAGERWRQMGSEEKIRYYACPRTIPGQGSSSGTGQGGSRNTGRGGSSSRGKRTTNPRSDSSQNRPKKTKRDESRSAKVTIKGNKEGNSKTRKQSSPGMTRRRSDQIGSVSKSTPRASVKNLTRNKRNCQSRSRSNRQVAMKKRGFSNCAKGNSKPSGKRGRPNKKTVARKRHERNPRKADSKTSGSDSEMNDDDYDNSRQDGNSGQEYTDTEEDGSSFYTCSSSPVSSEN